VRRHTSLTWELTLLALLALHGLLAALAPPVARRWGRGVFLLCAAAPAATTVWVVTRAPSVLAGEAAVESVQWAEGLGVSVDLRLDAFGLVMVALVSGIGALIFWYAHGYFTKPRPDLGKFAGVLTAFAGSMLGLVLADNVLVLFVFWELTSITSYLLIGFEDRKAEARDAALQALLVTALGGLALLGGLVILGQAAGTYSLSAMLAEPPAGGVVTAGLLLCLVGAFTKSAQVPFHTWLPGAMAAPTPVSAYLHSATMVKAGVYLIARLAPAFAVAPVWRPLVIGVGVATMLVGGYRALRQHDLKLLLAFGTVSQLGFMIALLGAGIPKATFAGVALLIAHGAFKAAVFMVVGIVDHEAGTRDLRRLTGLHAAMPATLLVAAVATASMAGLPPLFGFISKEAALEAFLLPATDFGADMGGTLALLGVVVGSILTFAYSARFLWGAFARKRDVGGRGAAGREVVAAGDVHAPPRSFVAPAALLAGAGLVIGLAPRLVDVLVNQAALALDPRWQPQAIALWHGVNVALALTVLVVGTGAVLFAARRTVERYQALVPPLPGSYDAYQRSVRGLVAGAKRLTGVVQNGSLPTYLMVIMLTVVTLPAPFVIGLLWTPAVPEFAAHGLQTVVSVLVVAATLGAVAARRRFVAVLFLGAVGYGVAILFVIHGAPDLALTQLLVETLIVVLFVLVLRHLPDRFARTELRAYRALRGAVAIAVGLFVFAFTLVAGAARTRPSISGEYLARALPEAHGRNVVNVILVDFRALDTLGEIVVLVVAGIGIASLVTAGWLGGRGSRAEQRGAAAAHDRLEEGADR
jgi:multicomponent Na+:H+ antiporter subunit A